MLGVMVEIDSSSQREAYVIGINYSSRQGAVYKGRGEGAPIVLLSEYRVLICYLR